MSGTQFLIAFIVPHTVNGVPLALYTLCDSNLFSSRTLENISKIFYSVLG
jgi:hypothetical protein